LKFLIFKKRHDIFSFDQKKNMRPSDWESMFHLSHEYNHFSMQWEIMPKFCLPRGQTKQNRRFLLDKRSDLDML